MPFLIIATTRSGTMLLTSFLNCHPAVRCYGEESWPFCRSLGENQGANLKYLYGPSITPANRGSRAIVLPGDDLSGFHVIHVIRSNLLELAISKVMNAHKDRYKRPAHVYIEPRLDRLGHELADAGPDSPRIRKISAELGISTTEYLGSIRSLRVSIDPAELSLTIRSTASTVSRWRGLLRRACPRLMELTYEQFTAGRDCLEMPSAASTRVCAFLGLEPRTLAASMRKVNDPDFGSYIENWEEIKDIELDLRNSYARELSAGDAPARPDASATTRSM